MFNLFKKKALLVCPYCGDKIERLPKLKLKCPSCRKDIYTNVHDTKLITKEEHQLERQNIRDENAFYKFFESKLTKGQLDKRKKQWFNKFKEKANYEDLIWSVCNEILNQLGSSNKFQEMSQMYFEMALFQAGKGKECSHLLQQSHKMQLLEYKQHKIIKGVTILTAPNACEKCQKLDGKRFTIKEALEKMPIPDLGCNHEMGYCRCIYSPIT